MTCFRSHFYFENTFLKCSYYLNSLSYLLEFICSKVSEWLVMRFCCYNNLFLFHTSAASVTSMFIGIFLIETPMLIFVTSHYCISYPLLYSILYLSEAILQRVYWNCMVVIAQAITTIYCSISNYLIIAFDKKKC